MAWNCVIDDSLVVSAESKSQKEQSTMMQHDGNVPSTTRSTGTSLLINQAQSLSNISIWDRDPAAAINAAKRNNDDVRIEALVALKGGILKRSWTASRV